MPENMPKPSTLPAANRFQSAPSFIGMYQHLFVCHLCQYSVKKWTTLTTKVTIPNKHVWFTGPSQNLATGLNQVYRTLRLKLQTTNAEIQQ